MKYWSIERSSDYIEHYGRKGMKWYQHVYGSDKDSEGSKRNSKSRTYHTKQQTHDKNNQNASVPANRVKRKLSPTFKATVKVAAPLAAAILVNVGSNFIAGGHNALLSAVTYEVGESAVERFFDYYESVRKR